MKRKPRTPTNRDVELMLDAIGLVTSYDLGCDEDDFEVFADLSREKNTLAMLRAMTQLAWLLAGKVRDHKRQEVLQWLAAKFVQRLETEDR